MKDAPINLPPLPDAVRFLKPSERLVRQQVVPILEAYASAAVRADRAGRVSVPIWWAKHAASEIGYPENEREAMQAAFAAPSPAEPRPQIKELMAQERQRRAAEPLPGASITLNAEQWDKFMEYMTMPHEPTEAAKRGAKLLDEYRAKTAEPPYGPNQRWHICPGCSHQFQSRGSAASHQEPPPVDNKFVAPGCEPFPQSVVDAVADVGSAAYRRIADAERLLIKAREELQNYLDDCPVTPEEPDTVKTVLAGIDAFIASAEPPAAPVYIEYDFLQRKVNELETERDQLRALLQEARACIWPSSTTHEQIRGRIDAALKGTPNE